MEIAIEKKSDQVKERSAVQPSDCWNVEALYPSWDVWQAELADVSNGFVTPYFPGLEAFKGTLSEGPKRLHSCLELLFLLDRKLSRLYTYAHLRHDEDVAADQAKTAFMKVTSLLHSFKQETAWMEPEILSLSDQELSAYLESEELKDYRIYLKKIVRSKAHTLKAEEEALLALGGDAVETAERAFSALNNADLKFHPVIDSKGNERELSHGTYQVYLRDTDRVLREGAFKNLHRSFSSFENTFAELLNGQIQKHLFEAKARKFPSCLEMALFPHEIDKSVYTSLIQAVREQISHLHRYLALRKKVLKLDALHLYDLSVPLVDGVTIEMPYPEAVDLIVQSLGVMGKDYVDILKGGLLKDRWVDRYENKRKRTGAYSSGCYDSMPYILMNYHGIFNDIMTLTHEAGHSMHSFHSRKFQPYPYSQYGIFLAEVASTFHEELLMQHLLKTTTDPKKKAYLLTQKIDALRATLIRQTLFAEFELQLHTLAENRVPLTASLLKKEYRKINQEYFGEEVVLDHEVDIEWARIPHFYYCFYVYQYATGVSAAQFLSRLVLSGEKEALQRYVGFLSAGSSKPPLEVLKSAGVDMSEPSVVRETMTHFGNLVDELERVMGE